MFNTILAGSGRRSELAAEPSSHYTKESTMRKSILTALIAAVVMMGFTVASASADSIGQCNQFPGNSAHSVSQWEHFLIQEGVLGQAKSQIFAKAGYREIDQTVKQWLSQRVMLGEAAAPFSGEDYGCRNGSMFSAGRHSYAKGKQVVYVLPGQDKKSTKHHPGNFATHRTKSFSQETTIKVIVIGLSECGNTFFVAEVEIVIYVAKHHKKHPHPKPPAPKVPVGFVCAATGLTVASPTQCVVNVIEGPKTSGAGNCNSTNAGNLSGTGDTQGSCNVTTVTCNGEGSCSPKTENICPANAAGGTGTTSGTGGPANAEACKTETVVVPPKTCEEEGNCPKEKTCQESGEVGVYPNCHPKTCQEQGNCPPPPHCENGEVGTYPNCRPRTCEELGTCPPPPSPPTIVSVTKIDDVEVGEFLENICVTTEMPGNDTGTLTMEPEYGSFGPAGKKVTFTVKGLEEECVTYYAPHNEVPPGGEDELTVTLRDNQTGLSAPPKVQKFRILPKEVNPS
jgi:hypothetical protein